MTHHPRELSNVWDFHQNRPILFGCWTQKMCNWDTDFVAVFNFHYIPKESPHMVLHAFVRFWREMGVLVEIYYEVVFHGILLHSVISFCSLYVVISALIRQPSNVVWWISSPAFLFVEMLY